MSWSHAGYHLDRLAFYTIADAFRLYPVGPAVKLSPGAVGVLSSFDA